MTLNIDDKMLKKASRLTGAKEKTSLLRLGMEVLIARESSKHRISLAEPKTIFSFIEIT